MAQLSRAHLHGSPGPRHLGPHVEPARNGRMSEPGRESEDERFVAVRCVAPELMVRVGDDQVETVPDGDPVEQVQQHD